MFAYGNRIGRIRTTVSIVGVSEKVRSFRELIVFILSSIQLYGLAASIELANITDVMSLYVDKQAGSNASVRRVLRLRYGLEIANFPVLSDYDVTLRQYTLLIATAASKLLWIIVALLLQTIIVASGSVSIVLHPTYSLSISLLLCVYALVSTAAAIGVRSYSGVLLGRQLT